MTQQQEPTYESRAEAAAFLLADYLRRSGNVKAAAAAGDMVAVATGDGGYNFGNVHTSYEADVHALLPADAVNSGPLAGEIPESATLYVNIRVHGLKLPGTDGYGYALPTHRGHRGGVTLRDPSDVPADVRAAARRLGIYE